VRIRGAEDGLFERLDALLDPGRRKESPRRRPRRLLLLLLQGVPPDDDGTCGLGDLHSEGEWWGRVELGKDPESHPRQTRGSAHDRAIYPWQFTEIRC
jgi:hypothetical protein